jgi:3-phenylpropionate/trans-cinnamate dioxygenase ferredoxin component
MGHLERGHLGQLSMPEVVVCQLTELVPGTVTIVEISPALSVGVYNCGGELYAIEDQCSHDEGPLCEGEFDCEERVAICPRHGARFDITTGRALTLPAYIDVDTFPVRVREDGMVVVEA